MDVFTAGVALIVVQVCVVLVMTGLFKVMPAERCTRYWALASACIAVGVLSTVLNAGAPRYLILLLGNGSIMLGLVLEWAGLRSFYRKPPSWRGWMVGGGFLTLFILLLINDAAVGDRSLLLAASVLIMLLLMGKEVWEGRKETGASFAGTLTLGGIGFLALCYAVNVITTLLTQSKFSFSTSSIVAITLFYLVPIGGTLLLSTGFLFLLFERVIAEKEHLAMHDELTGVLNRHAIELGAEREVRIAVRNSKPIAVAYVDIDLFKQINDRLGHGAGDQALVEAASILGKTCRSIDLVGRYGGDEFCLVLPGLDRSDAAAFGERLVTAFRQVAVAPRSAVTVSIGLAACDGRDGDCTWQNLTRLADQALYDAKKAGRNTFRVADENASNTMPVERFEPADKRSGTA